MEVIAKCGNRCDLCPAYTDNVAQNGAETVSENWQRIYGFYVPPEKIACGGCDADDCPHAADCGIRACCLDRGFDNCAYCGELICEKLQKNISAVDEMEKKYADISKEDHGLYILPYKIKETLLRLQGELKKGGKTVSNIELNEKPAEKVVFIRTNTDMENLPRTIGESYMKIMEYLAEQGMEPASEPYTAYYTLDMQNMDVEMGFPAVKLLPGKDAIKSREIPAGKYVECMYKGAYAGMEKVYGDVFKWMEEKGLVQDGPTFEYYYNSPEEVPESELLTRISLPVK